MPSTASVDHGYARLPLRWKQRATVDCRDEQRLDIA